MLSDILVVLVSWVFLLSLFNDYVGFPANTHEIVWLTLRDHKNHVDRCPQCGNVFKYIRQHHDHHDHSINLSVLLQDRGLMTLCGMDQSVVNKMIKEGRDLTDQVEQVMDRFSEWLTKDIPVETKILWIKRLNELAKQSGLPAKEFELQH